MASISLPIASIAVAGLLCLCSVAHGTEKPTTGRGPVSRQVERLAADGRCDKALSLARSVGSPRLAQKVRRHCRSTTTPPASATDPTLSLALLEGPPPPKGSDEAQIQAWVTTYVKPDGWSLADHDAQGVHMVTASGAELTTRSTLRVFGREELFQPAERAGLVGRSDRQEFEVDCASKRVRLISMEIFRDNNLAGPSQQIPGPLTDWITGRQGSHSAAQIEQLCRAGLHAVSGASPGPTPFP